MDVSERQEKMNDFSLITVSRYSVDTLVEIRSWTNYWMGNHYQYCPSRNGEHFSFAILDGTARWYPLQIHTVRFTWNTILGIQISLNFKWNWWGFFTHSLIILIKLYNQYNIYNCATRKIVFPYFTIEKLRNFSPHLALYFRNKHLIA